MNLDNLTVGQSVDFGELLPGVCSDKETTWTVTGVEGDNKITVDGHWLHIYIGTIHVLRKNKNSRWVLRRISDDK